MCPSMRCSTISPLFFSLSVIDLVILEKYYKISVFFNYCLGLPKEGRQGRKRRPGKRIEGPGTFGVPLLADDSIVVRFEPWPQMCPGCLHDLIWIWTSSSWALQFLLCSLNFFFFSSHKILEPIYARNRYENLVGVRLSFSSGASPPPLNSHGLWYKHLLTVILTANTLNFMSKCRIWPTYCLCFLPGSHRAGKMN